MQHFQGILPVILISRGSTSWSLPFLFSRGWVNLCWLYPLIQCLSDYQKRKSYKINLISSKIFIIFDHAFIHTHPKYMDTFPNSTYSNRNRDELKLLLYDWNTPSLPTANPRLWFPFCLPHQRSRNLDHPISIIPLLWTIPPHRL